MNRFLIAAAVATISLSSSGFAQSPAVEARLETAADRAEIIELSARFDNALDSEDADAFVATFTPDGVLEGFWGQSKGAAAIRQAHAYMLATFSKDKRHVVTNHVVSIDGDHAHMYCYLTVFDRDRLAVTGTATFSDDLVRVNGHWLFARRVLHADPNVDPIISKLKVGQ